MKNLLYIFLFFGLASFGQGNFYTFDMTEILGYMDKDWSIGNGIDEPYFEVEVRPTNDVMDFNRFELEIMNSKITVYADTINSNIVRKRFTFISELVVLGSTLSTLDVENPISLIMYPNPTNDIATFKGDFIEKLIVYDMNGRLIFRTSVNSTQYVLNVENYSNGTYIVQVWLSEKRGIFKKLIKI